MKTSQLSCQLLTAFSQAKCTKLSVSASRGTENTGALSSRFTEAFDNYVSLGDQI